MSKKIVHKRVPGARQKRFVEPKGDSVLPDPRVRIRISALKREHKLLVGVAGAQGWTDFRWGQSYVSDIVGTPPETLAGNYYVLRLWRSLLERSRTEEGEFAARIYLASIGETLD